MNIWLVTVGEPLPLPGEQARLWRCGLLARTLAARGHEVVWWTSTFDHIRKQYFNGSRSGANESVLGGVQLRWLHGVKYRRNLSIGRLINHAQLGWQLLRQGRRIRPGPHLILASFPTIELGFVAARLARKWGIPVVIDVRDLWPDIFVDSAPRPLRRVARLVLTPYFAMTRKLMRSATSLLAVSRRYLEWGAGVAGRPLRPSDTVFPLGYEPATPSDADRQAVAQLLSLRDDMTVAVFAGSFGRTYDLSTVIAAARLLQESAEHGLKFVLCGTGENDPELRRLAAGLSNVTFTGLLSASRLAAIFEVAAIGLAAYVADAPQGIPNKIVEYSCAGLAIVSSLEGETRELIAASGCGHTYAAADARGLADSLLSLSRDGVGLEQMRIRARDLYRSRFSASDVYAAMAEHLERVVQDAARKRRQA